MTRRTILSVTVTAIVAGTLCGCTSAQTTGDSGVDKATLERVLNAWASMDVSKAAPFYAKDSDLVFFDVAPLKYTGWTAYEQGELATFKNLKSVTIKLNDDAQVHSSGTVAWAAATLKVDMVPNTGTEMKMDARWSSVWEKRGSNWVIVHEHFSMPLPGESPDAAAKQ